MGDILFSPRDGRMGGIVLEMMGGLGGLVGQRKAIPGSAIEAVGPDAIVVSNSDDVVENADRLSRGGLVSSKCIEGYDVITDQGLTPDRGYYLRARPCSRSLRICLATSSTRIATSYLGSSGNSSSPPW